MTNSADRYTANVVKNSDITDFLSEAKSKLSGNISEANKLARRIIIGPNNAISLSKVGAAAEVPPAIRVAEPAPAPTTAPTTSGPVFDFTPGRQTPAPELGKLPAMNLSVSEVAKSTPPPAPTPSAELPVSEETVELEGGEIFSPSVNYINTEELSEDIPEFSPDIYSDKVTTLPPKPEPPTLTNVLTYHYGKDWVMWEPETVRQELSARGLIPDSKDETPETRILFDMVFASQLLYSHSGFMDFWRMYEKLCKAFNGSPVLMQEIQTTTPAEMVYFRKLINILRPDLKNEAFGAEVLSYQAACCFSAGFYVAPNVIKDCQPSLDKLLNSAETEAFKTSLWQAEDKLYNMTTPEFTKALDDMTFDETAGSIQIARHFAAIRYVREKVERLRSQLNLGS
jgi:hypothetical protein